MGYLQFLFTAVPSCSGEWKQPWFTSSCEGCVSHETPKVGRGQKDVCGKNNVRQRAVVPHWVGKIDRGAPPANCNHTCSTRAFLSKEGGVQTNGLSQAEQRLWFYRGVNGQREPDLPANVRGVTNPNTVLSLLFQEPDVCQSIWWGGAQAGTGLFWAGFCCLSGPWDLVLWVPLFTVKLKWHHLSSLDFLGCSKINSPKKGLHCWLCCQLGST